MAQPHVIQSWRVSPPPGYGAHTGQASDAGVTAQTTPASIAAATALAARLDQSVPPELTSDPTVLAFQQAYVDAGNTLPASAHASNGVDGLYGPNTAKALAATLGSNVPAPNIPGGGGGGPSPAPPVTPPSPAPSPSGGWAWWQWLLLALGVGGAGALGVRAFSKHQEEHGPRGSQARARFHSAHR